MNWQPGWEGGGSGVTRIPAAALGAPVSRTGDRTLLSQQLGSACSLSVVLCQDRMCVSHFYIRTKGAILMHPG